MPREFVPDVPEMRFPRARKMPRNITTAGLPAQSAPAFELHNGAPVRGLARRGLPGVAIHHFVADGKLAVAPLRGKLVRERGAKPASRKTAPRCVKSPEKIDGYPLMNSCAVIAGRV